MAIPLVYVDVTKSGWVRDDGFGDWCGEMADMPPMQVVADADRPEFLDPSPWLRIEDQKNQGSCRGHSLSTLMELLYYIETAGTIQFSRQMAYRQTQIFDGIKGDQGSTIRGGVKTASEVGLCLEELWPYPQGYQTDPPGGWSKCRENAANYRTEGAQPIRTYQEVWDSLASRLGGVDFGAMWFDAIDEQASRNEGVIETWRAPSRGVGGHAFAAVGYAVKHPGNGRKLTDAQGRPYIEIFNSWSERWGFHGRSWWSPTAVDSMLEHNWTECARHLKLKLGPGAVLPKWRLQS